MPGSRKHKYKKEEDDYADEYDGQRWAANGSSFKRIKKEDSSDEEYVNHRLKEDPDERKVAPNRGRSVKKEDPIKKEDKIKKERSVKKEENYDSKKVKKEVIEIAGMGDGGGEIVSDEEDPADDSIVTLLQLLDDKNMEPSQNHTGKGASSERELLRFYAKVGQITKKSRWEWKRSSDPDFVVVGRILDLFNQGVRSPNRKKWDALERARINGSSEWAPYRVD